jgi:hypothetical protein
MRPKIAMWSDYGAPRHKHWRSPSRRSSRSSIGPKILVVGAVIVAGVMGISGIYPQIIDSEWVQETSPRSQRVDRSEPAPTRRRSGIVAEIPLPPRRAALIAGEAIATPPAVTPPASAEHAAAAPPAPDPASPPVLSEMWPSVAATEQPQATDPDAALAITDVPRVQAIADLAKPAVVKPAQRYVARAPVVKRRVVRTEHQRSNSGAYAQYGGGGGWSGWPGLGSPYRF